MVDPLVEAANRMVLAAVAGAVVMLAERDPDAAMRFADLHDEVSRWIPGEGELIPMRAELPPG